MNRPITLLAALTVLAGASLALGATQTRGESPPAAVADSPTSATDTATVEATPTPLYSPPTVPARAPARVSAASTPNAGVSPTDSGTTDATRTAYVNKMYTEVVPARQRAALAGRYILGYNLAGLGCGTGCSGLFEGQARSSFNDSFFDESLAYQRNTVAHEAAHAYGYLYITNYTLASWADQGGWLAQFHALDRSFAGSYDAEAWASCVAWQESGFNDRVDQITAICTPQAAAAATNQIR
jgi:hypothetical protein